MSAELAQYKIIGTVSLKGNNYTDPEFYCCHFEDKVNNVFTVQICLTTGDEAKHYYTQTEGEVENETILNSIAELAGWEDVDHSRCRAVGVEYSDEV